MGKKYPHKFLLIKHKCQNYSSNFGIPVILKPPYGDLYLMFNPMSNGVTASMSWDFSSLPASITRISGIF